MECCANLMAQESGDLQRGVRVEFQIAKKILAIDKLNLTRLDGSSFDGGGPTRHNRTQSQNLTLAGHSQDYRSAIFGENRKLDAA
jgi:hypothetical protein